MQQSPQLIRNHHPVDYIYLINMFNRLHLRQESWTLRRGSAALSREEQWKVLKAMVNILFLLPPLFSCSSNMLKKISMGLFVLHVY